MRRPRVRQRKIEPSFLLKRSSDSWVSPGSVLEEASSAACSHSASEANSSALELPTSSPGSAPTISSR